MDLAYLLLALAIVSAALVVLAVASIAVGRWVRWLVASGPFAVVALALVAGAVVNVAVPRACLDGEVVSRQRPLTATLDSAGECRRMGLGQLAIVPLVGVAVSLLATRWHRGAPRPAATPGAG